MNKQRRIQQINNQTIAFMNLVENFSKTSTDIAEVCDKSAHYMKEPLKSIVEDFVTDIRIYGYNSKAFEKIKKKLEGCKLLEIFKSFEICQRHEGDFAKVVADSKKSVREFDKSIMIRRAIVANARGDLLALLLASGIVFVMLNDFLTKNVWEMLSTSPIGMGIIGYEGVCLALICWVILKGD